MPAALENCHRLRADVAPAALAGKIGYAGLTAVPFSDAGSIFTNLYWHQSFLDNRLAYIVGIVDVTDYVGVYVLVNPWTDFVNLAFSTSHLRCDVFCAYIIAARQGKQACRAEVFCITREKSRHSGT